MHQVIIKFVCLFVVFCAISFMPPIVEAQFGTSGIAPGTDPSAPITAAGVPNAPIVPFDGGLSLMLAAGGVSYCSKKLRKAKYNI